MPTVLHIYLHSAQPAMHPLLLPLQAQMQLPSPLQMHTVGIGTNPRQTIWVKHEEAIHPQVAGNKWRKLAPHLQAALSQNATSLATYGGPYSQHLLAVAWCANALKLPSTGYVRGEIGNRPTPLLACCLGLGMQLCGLPRAGFAQHALAASGLDGQGCYRIPLGGASPQSALAYGQSLWTELQGPIAQAGITQIWVSAGTGTSAAGLWQAAGGTVPLHVVPAYKPSTTFWADMARLTSGKLQGPTPAFRLNGQLPYTRFGKPNPALQTLADEVQAQTGLCLEPVYEQRLFAEALAAPGTGKLIIHNGHPNQGDFMTSTNQA